MLGTERSHPSERGQSPSLSYAPNFPEIHAVMLTVHLCMWPKDADQTSPILGYKTRVYAKTRIT